MARGGKPCSSDMNTHPCPRPPVAAGAHGRRQQASANPRSPGPRHALTTPGPPSGQGVDHPGVCDAADVESDFVYSNRSRRPRGPVLSTLSTLVPGIRAVQEQVQPYAVWWESHNRVAAAGRGPLWVALGDSMAQGIGGSAPDRGWVGQLDGRLVGRGWEHR